MFLHGRPVTLMLHTTLGPRPRPPFRLQASAWVLYRRVWRKAWDAASPFPKEHVGRL